MKRYIHVFSLCLIFFITGCEKETELKITEEGTSHTSLIYIVADNSLNYYPEGDIKEMIEGYKEVQDQKNNTLLVYIDDYSTPRLLRITSENGQVISKTIREFPEQNSLEMNVMAETINESLSQFAADSYGLVLWSHGNGWLPGTDQQHAISTRAFGEDTDDGDSHQSFYMDIIDLKNVLSTTPGFEYIVFDACNMQGIEVAYELRGSANYIIGSPVEVSAYGAPYDDMVPAFFSDSNKAGNIAAAFFNQYSENFSDSDSGDIDNGDTRSFYTKSSFFPGKGSSTIYPYGIAISVVNTNYLDELAQATGNILKDYEGKNIPIKTQGIYNYDSNYYNFYYDLKDLMQEVSDPGSTEWKKWQSAFQKAVPVFLTTSSTYSSFQNNGFGGKLSMSNANGVSTFVPFNANFQEAYKWSRNSEKENADTYRFYMDYYNQLDWYKAAGWENFSE